MKNYYAVLEVKRDADHDTIRKAYRKLAQKYHPDISTYKGADELFTRINEAYDVLSHPAKRKEYDLKLFRQNQAELVLKSKPQNNQKKHFYAPEFKKAQSSSISSNNYSLQKYLSYFTIISRIAFLFCLVVILDNLMPYNKFEEKIVNIENGIFHTEKGTVMPIPKGYDFLFHENNTVVISKTPFFQKTAIMKMKSNPMDISYFKSHYSIFFFTMLVMMVFAMMGGISATNVKLKLFSGLFSGALMILNVILLIGLP